MKIHLFPILILTLILSVNAVSAQEADSSRINLTKTPVESAARNAVWRTDFYICTGIAYAKSVGKTTDDFMKFVAETHIKTFNPPKGKELEYLVKVLNFSITSYPNGTFEIVSESKTKVKARANRPYIRYFNNGYMIGVTLDEFEKCLWGHTQLMFNSLGIEFDYNTVGDHMELTMTLLD